jgi:hypothetical protein
MLTQRRSYKTSEPTSEYWHEVEIDGTVVVKGDVSPNRTVRNQGIPQDRYRFQYAEVRPSGEVMLMFYGPVACCQWRAYAQHASGTARSGATPQPCAGSTRSRWPARIPPGSPARPGWPVLRPPDLRK